MIDKECDNWDNVIRYWSELDDLALTCIATVQLSVPTSVNGEFLSKLVGSLGVVERVFEEFESSMKVRKHPIISGWNIILNLEPKPENDGNQQSLFLPFDSIIRIDLHHPIDRSKILLTKIK